MNALLVANYFIDKAYEEEDLISNMKLQKLLYYAQGYHLAIHNSPLFEDDIEKWPHGPVVRNIYHEFKSFGSNAIAPIKDFDMSMYPDEVVELLEEIYSVYGQFSASALRNITHQETPWVKTPDGDVISKKVMKAYFKKRILEE